MDNLSHSVVGLALGELVQRSLAPEPDAHAHAVRRRMLLVSCWAASNVPDLDLVFKGLLPVPLGYLLHHRGHTHTLLYAVPQALLLMALVWLLWPSARRLLGNSGAARIGLLAATALGLITHLSMDFLNSYGVHPFHPVDSRWFYGDLVFILEPVFWVAFGAPLAMMVRSRLLKPALLALLGAILVWSALKQFLHWESVLALAAAGTALAWFQQRAGIAGRRAIAAAFVLVASFIGVQAWTSSHGKDLIARELQRIDPASRLLDTAMTAFPANPFCWIFISVERNDTAGIYRVRRGQWTTGPVQACPAGLSEAGGAKAFTVTWEHEGALGALGKLASNCHFHAWMRFARTPVIEANSATDIRFSRSRGANFSTMDLDNTEGRPCPSGVPPWRAPREDLLAP